MSEPEAWGKRNVWMVSEKRNVQTVNQEPDDTETYRWPNGSLMSDPKPCSQRNEWMTSKKSDVTDGKPEV